MPKRVRVVCFDRRQFLQLGSAAVGAAALPGCETLDLPAGLVGELPDPLTPNDQFYVQSCCGTPAVDVDAWSLDISVLGELVAQIDVAFLESLTLRTKEHTLQCIGGGPSLQQISNAVWGGLPLREILDLLGVELPSSVVGQKWRCADFYETGLPVEDVETMWAVWRMNDEPLPADHGGPLRLLTPGRYGTKNPKWPIELDFLDTPYEGFWERLGWSDSSEYLANTFIGAPRELAVSGQGEILVRGTAFAGDDPVEKVELPTAGGESWFEVELYYQGGADVWSLWRHTWRPPEPGVYLLQARVTTVSGAQSSPDASAPFFLNGYDGSMASEVEVG